MRAFRFVIPGADEQQEIVRYLQTSIERLSAAITQTAQAIALLKKYRTRLIADAVTGKLDVREAAAALPEEPDMPGADRAEAKDDAVIQRERQSR